VTTVRVAKGIDANRLRLLARDELDVSLGSGLGPLDGKAFRIGHMGWVNEPMVLGALGAVEIAMQACGVPYRKGGVTAAVDALAAARFPEASRADTA
jgi:alanine-glyoxylate transaminase/serine-glyoxylate transaminase/serine-pyruvate transaminase